MLEDLREIAKEYTTAEINLETDLRMDLGMTSFDLISMVGEIEEKYDVQISEEEIADIVTVSDLIKYIESKK